jgi:rubredoxin
LRERVRVNFFRLTSGYYIGRILIPPAQEISMKKYMCLLCGYIYDELAGCPEEGIEPGTPWEKVPEDWLCPECGAGKADFVMVEI